MTEPFDAVLWDADGVLQHARPGWRERLDGMGGPGFAEATFAAEAPALTGETTMRAVMAELLERWPASATVDQIIDVWDAVDLDPAAVALAQEVRARGIWCALATNQQDHRTSYMRSAMGYDQILDGACYSSEVGAAKPTEAFFIAALACVAAGLGVERVAPERVAFLDDAQANVDGAAALGIRGVWHDPATGADGLRADLASVGLHLDTPSG